MKAKPQPTFNADRDRFGVKSKTGANQALSEIVNQAGDPCDR